MTALLCVLVAILSFLVAPAEARHLRIPTRRHGRQARVPCAYSSDGHAANAPVPAEKDSSRASAATTKATAQPEDSNRLSFLQQAALVVACLFVPALSGVLFSGLPFAS
ncbi:hypothetical protein DIPPA_65658, partial [Diplonema papillatum]